MTTTALQSDLRASRERLFETIRGLSEEQFRFVPAGETWCIAAHLAHLLRIERLFVERAARALQEDHPRMKSTRIANHDDPALAQHLAVPQIIHGMQAARRDLTAILDLCDDTALQRAIVHERIGRMTIEQIARKMSDHEGEHAESISGLARQARDARRVVIPISERKPAAT